MSDQAADPVGKPISLFVLFAGLSTLFLIGRFIHQVFFDPLRHIPGPKINALTRIPYVRHLLAGTTKDNVEELHRQYGEVVRVSPNEVSFSSGETAWPDIYGFRTGSRKSRPNMPKDPFWYAPPANGVKSILLADDEDHSRGRRLLAHAFSEKALAEQEPLLQNYVDQLVDRLKEVTLQQPVQDMTKWYNWITFDIVADLLFGEPFGCLQNLETHKHITLLFDSVKSFSLMYILGYFPYVKYLGNLVFDSSLIVKRKEYMNWVSSQVTKRIEKETQRPDFMTHIMAHNGEKGIEMSKGQLDSNANLILTAGSETTATLLSGATYLLCTNPEKLAKLEQEVRRWKQYDDITLSEVNNSPYLIAVLSESLRYFPPVPAGFERRALHDGEVISGVYIPKGTAVSVSQWPTHHSEANFKDCNSFVPERWMGLEEYANDKRAAMQPFSFGPRNCLGKNLAYAEMRLIMAKLIWSFDLQLENESKDWMARCRVRTLWDKPPLLIRLTPVVRD